MFLSLGSEVLETTFIWEFLGKLVLLSLVAFPSPTL